MALGRHLLLISCASLFTAAICALPPQAPKKKIDFNRDIRPIIDKCLTCHGNDKNAVMAGLRLDIREGAIATLEDGNRAIVPGHPEQSEMIARIYSTDEGMRMPPPDSNKKLSDEDKALLKLWIEEGAEYKKHWSFVAPVRHEPPAVKDKAWVKNPIDNFVLAHLEEKGLKPSKEADKRTLIRRVSLDLTGLPPTPAEVDAFLKDKSPKAYEKVVDRLLASPRYGERMAMDWLDYARYADSNGYQADWERFQWRWRDWVLNAFNSNMPYDQFTVEQIAGDMLPNATLDQKLATGFNRNHRINTEGGVIAEEWRVENVIDRVETTSYTWLGLTSGCARCHDHKYDPISQKEFYGLFAYFNNVPESGTGEERPVNHPPFMKAPYPEQAKLMASYDKKLGSLNSRLSAMRARNFLKAQSWKLDLSSVKLPEGVVAEYGLNKSPKVIQGKAAEPKIDGEVGLEERGVVTGDKGFLDLGGTGDFDTKHAFSFSLWVNPETGNGAPISKMDVGDNYRGWDLFLQGGRPAFHLIDSWPMRGLKVTSRKGIPVKQWSHITVTYDGSAKPNGVRIFVNGEDTILDTENDSLSGSTRTKVSLKIGRRTGADVFAGKVDDLVIYDRALQPGQVQRLGRLNQAWTLLSIPADKRSKEQSQKLAEIWSQENDSQYRDDDAERAKTEKERATLDSQISTVMVMEEMPKPRTAYVLLRGQYDKHGDTAPPTVPAFLPPLPRGAPNNRLGLAEWLVDPSNPLTARVAVNRMWERLFGIGIVETSEDFGTRATFPSHPELLDWLATEFVRLKWNQKAMWKTMVMSATYRQSSDVTPELAASDPANRLLARGPRYRLNAEVLRDQAMYFGGMLVEKVGGPSVRPYQPNGIWDEMNVYGNLRNYKHDEGPGLRRRSLYTIWKRTAAPPNMTLFDMPSRETCRIRRARTDTPLQALNMLNDVTYVEASRALALRMLKEGGSSPASQLAFAYRVVLSREPSSEEVSILSAGLARRLEHYKSHPEEAKKLIAMGDLPNPASISPSVIAAYTLTASTILNLDEAITKE